MKIYTKTGDKGNTSLIGGVKVSKAHLRIESYGTIDELNSFIGLLRASAAIDTLEETRLTHIQHILFNLGSELATANGKENTMIPMIAKKDIEYIEQGIDRMDIQLKPLQQFILPAGVESVAQAHVCRTICRRAERCIVHLNESEPVSPHILVFINRLSDYFFVLARYIAFMSNTEDIYWDKEVNK